MNGKEVRIVWIVALTTLLAISTAAAQTVTIDVPADVYNGSQFTVTVVVDQATNLAGFDIFLKYDPTVLQYDGYSLGADAQAFSMTYDLVQSADTVEIAALTSNPAQNAVTGTNLEILQVTFTALAEGQSPLEFAAGTKLVQYDGTQVVDYTGVTFQNTTVTVQAPAAPAPTPAGCPGDVVALDTSVTLPGENGLIDFKFLNVDVERTMSLQYYWQEDGEIQIKMSPWSSDYSWKVYRDGSLKNSGTGDIASLPMPDPGYYNVRIEVYDGTTLKDYLVLTNTQYTCGLYIFKREVTTLPQVSISIKGSPVVKGDAIYFDVSVSNLPANATTLWTILGPSEMKISGTFADPSGGLVKLETDKYIKSPYNMHSGTYKFVVIVKDEYGNTLTIVGQTFEVVDISIDLLSPTEGKVGQKLKLEGTTNVADTESIYDADRPNEVYIEVTRPQGDPIGSIIVPVRNGVFKWPGVITLLPWYETGSYKVYIRVDVSANSSDDATFYFTVTEPAMEFTLAKQSYIRSEGIYLEGNVEVSEWNIAAIFVYCKEDPELNDLFDYQELLTKYSGYYIKMRPPGESRDYWGIIIPINVGYNFKSQKLHINKTAEKKTYTLVGVLGYYADGVGDVSTFTLTDYTMVTSIRVVKETLVASLSQSKVTRGEEIKLSGEAVLSKVYVFTDRENILVGVPKIPRDDNPFTASEVDGSLYPISVKDGKFETILRVGEDRTFVRPDTYLIYVIEPADQTEGPDQVFDPTEDPMAILSLTVVEFAFEKWPDTIQMVPGDYVDVFVKVNGDPDLVEAYMEIEGHGVKVPYTNMRMSKYNESGSGWLFATIYPFYDKANAILTSEFDPKNKPALVLGSYVVKFYLYDEGSQVDEETAILEVIPEDITVTINNQTGPEVTVVKGEDLVVKIDTNRKAKGYDDIHVIFDLGSTRQKYLHNPLDENGDTKVVISTAGIPEGEYYLYVRDRMKTYTSAWDWDKHYDYDPIKEYYAAKDVWGQDDTLVVKKIKIVEAAPPAPTPTTPAVTPTTPPPATPTPTTPPVEVTTTPTPPPVTTTPKGGIPGFEAIFAIAGLLAVAYLLRRK
jgi:PGF-CTERM protein